MTSVTEPDIHTTAGKLADLRKRTEETLHPVGEAAVEKTHAKGKLTARERILALLDEDSFVELDGLARHRSTNFGLQDNRPVGDGVVTGYGTIDGRDVCIFSQDAMVFGGSLGEVYGEKIVKVQELAIKTGRPLIGINDGAGARIQEGVVSLGLYSKIFRNNILASGVIPQISLIMGAAAGGHVYSPALTDFVIMVNETSQMFITGPDVIKTVTGEDVTMEELGGAQTHMSKSGTAHYVASGEQDAFDYVRELLSYLPANNYAEPPRHPAPPHPGAIEDNLTEEDLELDTLIPDSPNQPYDMHEVITRILDDDEFLEVQSGYAQNIIVGFGRVDGRQLFSAKELTLEPGAKITVKDAGASGWITVQGEGRVGVHEVATPTLIRFGQMTADELFISADSAAAGYVVENTGPGPLVSLRYFGPDVQSDLPKHGRRA